MNSPTTTTKTARAIVAAEPLRSILPLAVDSSKYEEADLALIDAASRHPLGSWEDATAAKTAIISALMEVAIAYGFTVDQSSRDDQIAFKECAAVVLTQCKELGIEQVRHAFRVSHKTGADLEAYGKRFNAAYLKRIMDAYIRYVNEVLPALRKKEERAAIRAEAAAKYEREQAFAAAKREAAKRTWPLKQCQLIVRDYARHLDNNLQWHEASSTLITLLKEVGMLDGLFDDDDRAAMMKAATEAVMRRVKAERFSKNLIQRARASLRLMEIERGALTADTRAAIIAEYCKEGLRQFFISYALDWAVEDMANNLFLAMKAAGKATKEEFIEHVNVPQILKKIEDEKAAESARKAAIEQEKKAKEYLVDALKNNHQITAARDAAQQKAHEERGI